VPYLQQQYYPINELADRAPTTTPVAAPLPPADAAQPEAVTP
jgi:hypothetical protein